MNTTTQGRGKFIVLAGCEGAGKTTQIQNLKAKYTEAVFFREPGGTEFAEEVRSLMLTSKYAKGLTAYEQMNLAFAGRSQNIRDIVGPALEAGKTVFVDRYDCCSFAYQIFGMDGSSLFDLFSAHRLVMGDARYLPDLYVILDVSPEEGMKRVSSRKAAEGKSNHFDDRGADFHARVREGYQRFAEAHFGRVVMVDAHPPKEEVWKSIEKAVQAL
jgi:dTMP kinase